MMNKKIFRIYKNTYKKILCIIPILFTQALNSAEQPQAQGNGGQGEQGAPALVARWNNDTQAQGLSGGQFEIDAHGNVIFNGTRSPQFAVDYVLDSLGLEKGYSTGGIDPFKYYSHEEFRESYLCNYYLVRGFTKDRWVEINGENAFIHGTNLLKGAKEKLGTTVFKDMHEHQLKVAEQNTYWDNLKNNAIPFLYNTATDPKFIGIFLASLFALLYLPLMVWNLSKAFSAWIFARRPEILSYEDTDICHAWWKRLFYKFPTFPKVIVNAPLREKLKNLIADNKRVTRQNKAARWDRNKSKSAYHHCMAYGERGTGKTLFAKSLAQKAGMHFIYLTVADLSIMEEKKALETLKDYFTYARRGGPCVFIVDEADRLFSGEDIKSKKLALLFQREFSRAVDENIQLFFITNYPWTFPDPILNRIYHRIHFDKPTFEVQKDLFTLHLKRALRGKAKKLHLEDIVDALTARHMEGLVGRDIEAIAQAWAMGKERSATALLRKIEAYKSQDAEMKAFKVSQMPKKEKKPLAPPVEKKQKSLW